MEAQVRNCRLHGSRAQESLKLPMARGQNMGLVRHLRSGVGGESTRIVVTTEGYWMHPEAPAVTIIGTAGRCCEEGFTRNSFVRVRTLATKRVNARRREIDRRAFFVSRP